MISRCGFWFVSPGSSRAPRRLRTRPPGVECRPSPTRMAAKREPARSASAIARSLKSRAKPQCKRTSSHRRFPKLHLQEIQPPQLFARSHFTPRSQLHAELVTAYSADQILNRFRSAKGACRQAPYTWQLVVIIGTAHGKHFVAVE